MKYFYYISVAVIFTAMVSVFVPQLADAEVNILQPRGESEWATGDNDGIRDYVEDVFGNNHIMVDVALCESGFRQYYSGGDVLITGDSNAVGVFQLLESWHEEAAKDRGYSIYTVEGNVGYAQELYEEEGLKPWSPSSLCWDDGRVSETNVDGSSGESTRTQIVVRSRDSSRSSTKEESDGVDNEEEEQESKEDEQEKSNQRFLGNSDNEDGEDDVDVPELISKKLIIGVHDEQVVTLQELLNRIGYQLATSGPGSPGEETNYFGSLTKQALQRFQCDSNIICNGVEYTTGYGMTDARTRAALNKQAADTPGQRTSNRVQIQVRSESDRSNREDTSTDNETGRDNLMAQIDELSRQIADLRAQLSR